MEDMMVKVEQSDRDAAAALWLKNRPESGCAGTESNYWWHKLKAGEFDHNESAQAFAAYREAIMERAAGIVWKAFDDIWETRHGEYAADAIREHGGTHDTRIDVGE